MFKLLQFVDCLSVCVRAADWETSVSSTLVLCRSMLQVALPLFYDNVSHTNVTQVMAFLYS